MTLTQQDFGAIVLALGGFFLFGIVWFAVPHIGTDFFTDLWQDGREWFYNLTITAVRMSKGAQLAFAMN